MSLATWSWGSLTEKVKHDKNVHRVTLMRVPCFSVLQALRADE